MKVISVHSVFGGVGKTLIAFSCAAQLAKLGSKTAILELPHDGAVLHGWLYPLLPDNYQPLTTETFSERISMANLKFPAVPKLERELYLGLASPNPQDTSNFSNAYVMHDSSPAQFSLSIGKVLRWLKAKGFEFIFIDNPPGISFLAGINISFLLEQCLREQGEKQPDIYEIWFGCRTSSSEIAKTLYEMAIYQEFLEAAHPRLIVNPLFDQQSFADKKSLISATGQQPLWKNKEKPLHQIVESINLATLIWDGQVSREDPAFEIERMMQKIGVHGQIFTHLINPML